MLLEEKWINRVDTFIKHWFYNVDKQSAVSLDNWESLVGSNGNKLKKALIKVDYETSIKFIYDLIKFVYKNGDIQDIQFCREFVFDINKKLNLGPIVKGKLYYSLHWLYFPGLIEIYTKKDLDQIARFEKDISEKKIELTFPWDYSN